MKQKEKALILSQEPLASDVYSMWIKTDNVAANAKPGQFIAVYSKDGSRILPRPISICEVGEGKIRIVYRVVGKGTDEFSRLQADDYVEIMGPLGNGYTLQDKKAILIAGGIGIPPMLELAKQLKCEKQVVLGYRDELFLNKEFEPYANVTIATENGSYGTKGNVLDAIRENAITGDVIYACGPTPMLRAIKQYALDNDIEAYVSLEEKMACGIGACLACVCKSKEVDEHTHVHNKRICKDGPVFNVKEVEL
ncbi:MAG: dihydroorotate dehydrogenase electron transfer subunit [Lachnospiraceae bacterium]|nr:dihydroorotate dehydrogenase electron transfer subunit [Lachnospiraceae bacterium]